MSRLGERACGKQKDCMRLAPDSARCQAEVFSARANNHGVPYAVTMSLSLNRDMNRFFVIQLVFLSFHSYPRARSSEASRAVIGSAA